MRKIKRMIATMMASVIMMGTVSMVSYAANIKITSLSLVVDSEVEVGGKMDSAEIEVSSKGGKFTITDVDIVTEGFEWQPEDEPVFEVRLEAEDGYYFSVTTKNIKIKGATYVKGKREGSQTLVLTLKLPSLMEVPGTIEEANWVDGTAALWSSAYNIGNYEVRLYRDGVNVKGTQITTGTSLELGNGMTKAGTYQYRVRGVNQVNSSNKSPWVESSSLYVDADMATTMREKYGTATTGLSEPGLADYGQTQQSGWIQDKVGWWYRNGDGNYAKNNWQLIDTKWYYFDSNGYMVTGWIQSNDKWYYCDLAGGHMLTNSLTPDGLRVDSEGVWIQ